MCHGSSHTARPLKVSRAGLAAPRRHAHVTSVTYHLTGQLPPQCLANHPAQLFSKAQPQTPRPQPRPAIFGNVMLGTPIVGYTSEEPSSQNNPKALRPPVRTARTAWSYGAKSSQAPPFLALGLRPMGQSPGLDLPLPRRYVPPCVTGPLEQHLGN